MKVYVAEREYDHEGFVILGIYTTKEQAERACKNDFRPDQMKLRGDSYSIEEFEIDATPNK